MKFDSYAVKGELKVASKYGPDVEEVVFKLLQRKPWLCCLTSLSSAMNRFDIMILLDVVGAEYMGYSERIECHLVQLGNKVYKLNYYKAGQVALYKHAREMVNQPNINPKTLLNDWVLK